MTQDAKKNKGWPQNPGRIVLIAILILNIVGLLVALELSKIHYSTHTNPDYISVCAINEKVNCETVARSPYSVFLGVPISGWGTIAYTLLIILCSWGLVENRLHRHWPQGLLFFAFVAAFGASGILAYISFFIIDSMCLFCMTLYGINTLLLGAAIALAKIDKLNPFIALAQDVRALFRRPQILLPLGVTTVMVAVSALVFFPRYWEQIGWNDLPPMPTGTDNTGAHWIGAQKPVLTIYEYSDYECPHCRRAHKNMRSIVAKYPDTLRLVHKHMPLDKACNKTMKRDFHKRACEFSKAVECAAAQNNFWKMNDALFAIQNSTPAANVDVGTIAVQLGLDRRKFNGCMSSNGPMKQIQRELKEGLSRNIAGTPTFFIGNQPFPGGIAEKTVLKYVKRNKKLSE